jgi:hypothetical protein
MIAEVLPVSNTEKLLFSNIAVKAGDKRQTAGEMPP